MAPRRRASRGSKAAKTPPKEEAEGEEEVEAAMDVDEEEEHEDDSSDEGEPVVPLLATRERRANAGNRMAALLEDEAQAEVEEMFKEDENDNEFQAKFEEDVFDSDFGSTDSGNDDEDDEEAGERQLQREAKAASQGQRKKALYTPFLPSFARQTKYQQRSSAIASTSASTLDGNSTSGEGTPAPTSFNSKRKRGWPDGIDPAFMIPQRESARRSAVAFKESVEGRLKESEQRRATLPKPSKKQQQSFTQADLIAEALETEEVNRASLLAFYAAEEDRRAAERVLGMRYEIIGPKVSFLSRREGGADGPSSPGKRKGKGKALEGGAVDLEKESGRRRMIEVLGESGKAGWTPGEDGGLAAAKEAAAKEGAMRERTREMISPVKVKTAQVTSMTGNGEETAASIEEAESSNAPHLEQAITPQLDEIAPKLASSSSAAATSDATPAPPLTVVAPTTNGTTQGVIPAGDAAHARNYLIFDEFIGATATEEMEALFGDHCDWATSKTATLKSNRRAKICPITGLPAKYRDPRTMTPYANQYAYNVLTRLVEQSTISTSPTTSSFVWNDTLGAYTGVVGLGRLQTEINQAEPYTGTVMGTIENDPIAVAEQAVKGGKSGGYMGVGGRNAKRREYADALE